MRARSRTSRTSFTDALTADSGSNALAVVSAMSRASVVLPVPGGPQKITEDSRSSSMSARSGRPGASRWSWPTTSSRVRGRRRAASGAWWASRSRTAAANRSSAIGDDRTAGTGAHRSVAASASAAAIDSGVSTRSAGTIDTRISTPATRNGARRPKRLAMMPPRKAPTGMTPQPMKR